MAIDHPAPPLGYDEYAAIDDGQRYQLIEGELFMCPAPSERHQRVLGMLYVLLATHVRATRQGRVYLSPFDVVLRAQAPGNVVQPDVLFLSTDSLKKLTAANLQGAPDLAIEVLSPSNARLDTVRKLGLYERYGVREYWIVPVDFDRIEVLRTGDDGHFGRPQLYIPGDTLETPLMPGLALAVASVFAED